LSVGHCAALPLPDELIRAPNLPATVIPPTFCEASGDVVVCSYVIAIFDDHLVFVEYDEAVSFHDAFEILAHWPAVQAKSG
jgi:hypothetical protein